VRFLRSQYNSVQILGRPTNTYQHFKIPRPFTIGPQDWVCVKQGPDEILYCFIMVPRGYGMTRGITQIW